MPRGWRSAARSIVWPPRWTRAETSRLRGDAARAFADRAPIDWPALLRRLRDPADRRWAEGLRRLDSLRSPRAAEERPPVRRPRLLLPLVWLAALQTAFTLAHVLAAGACEVRVPGIDPRLVLTLAFGAASVLLLAAAPRDSRILYLLCCFTFAAAAFGRAAAAGTQAPAGPLLRGVFPEAFIPAALWEFASVFPHVRRFARFDLAARRIAAGAWGLGGMLFVMNLALEYGVVRPAFAGRLARDHPGDLFWHLFAALALPALLAMLVRARRAGARERRKALRFTAAAFACTAPLLAVGLARVLVPSGDLRTAAPGGVPVLDVLVLGGLTALPILTTLAAIVDRTFDPRIAVSTAPPGGRRAPGGWLRWAPGRRAHRERLPAALARVRTARGARELMSILREELEATAAATDAEILDRSALPPGSCLPALLSESYVPLDLSGQGPLYGVMPRADRAWLASRGIVLAAPLVRRDGTVAAVAALGARRDGRPYSRADRWFVGALLAGSAALPDLFHADRGTSHGVTDAALECPACGIVAEQVPLGCGCAVAAGPAAIPLRLAGKFTVRRRIGSGGTGLVYLARDEALERDVALKTLPVARPDTVSRLRDEARIMASLDHDALATIYGLEVWRDTPILVVEFFRQGTLADALGRGPMHPAAVAALGVRLAHAIEYMHARGILHRDVKPSNIGMADDGSPRLLDFGLAGDARPLAGTPAYLPPEALDGAPPDEAGDLWGLALVLAKACGGLQRAPEGLRAILDRALARNPAARFPSARALREALEAAARDR